jgi:hypothetical protein
MFDNLDRGEVNISGESAKSSLPEQPIESKEERIEREKRDVLSRAVSGQIENMRDRVAFILNYSNEARNSDIDLLWNYWETFEESVFSGSIQTKEQMKKLARLSSLTRIRAKIQNEYKLFQADDVVKRFRGTLEDDKRIEAIEDKPSGLGTYGVYIDETGKTQDYLSVGSLWILKFELSSTYAFKSAHLKWTKENEINYEFHFNDVTKNKLSFYKAFFTKFLTAFPEAGFKLIVVNNKGFADKAKAITDLTYHLISKGIEHENSTGRAPLPRILDVMMDEEEKGSDQLKIENIRERLKSQNISGLYFGDFEAVSSEGSFFLQIVDLFTGSINRKLHSTTQSHHKDELAEFILNSVNFEINNIDKQNEDIDNSALFNLSEYKPLNPQKNF